MINTLNHTISQNATLSEAIKKMGEPGHARVLFVLNSNNKIVGTITDGDIRRGLLEGYSVNDECEKFAFKNFKFINKNNIDLHQIREWRNLDVEILPVLSEEGNLIEILNFKKLKSYLPISAVIMAGGLGMRLRPLTLNTPKPMLKVGDIPILEINIKRLTQYGVKEIFLCIGYLKEQIMDYFGDGSRWNCSIRYIEENEPMGTIGALSLIQHFSNENVLLFNADLLSNIDFEEMYLKYSQTDSNICIATIPHKVTLPYAVLEEKNDQIKSLVEKPTYTFQANAGFYLFNRDLLSTIPQNTFYNATDFVEKALENRQTVQSFPILGYWNDIGSIQDYEKSQDDIKSLHLFDF
jgi:dTDP-glucose pyrophosphorylase